MTESTKNHVQIPVLDRDPPDLDDDTMAVLEKAMKNQDVIYFLTLVNEISWSNQPPSAFVKAIRAALTLEAPLIARRLAEQGSKIHPKNAEINKIARVLAPPTVTTAKSSAGLSVKANKLWLDTHREEYKRKWVALHNGELIQIGNSFSNLKARVGDIKGKGILVTQVT